MKREDLRIGQRIILTEEVETLDYIAKRIEFKAGMRGKIINIHPFSALIEFDDYISGHDGCGRGKYGHCWWLYKKDLIRIAHVYKRKNNY